MYKFIDTNETSVGVLLPTEALKINGEYIENLIDGYRTLSVEGREALSPELSTYETGIKDGARLLSKRYPARTIIVKYQLIAKNAEEFRAAYNKLGSILNVKDAELIFDDEQDKYFIGTPSAMGSVEPGRNAVVSEFEILCTDPFKYSVVEYEAKPQLDETSILINYNGTYKAYPTLEADFYSEKASSPTSDGECGYVAFFNEAEKIIQIGDPDETDTEDYAKSQTLINPYFTANEDWNDTTEGEWALNAGHTVPLPSIKQLGSVGIVPATYESLPSDKTSEDVLAVISKSELPYVYYNVTLEASERTEETIKVKAIISASLWKASNYFGKGRNLKASIQLGGEWHSVMLKESNDNWRGNSAHTKNITVVVDGLAATDSVLKDIKFKVERTDDKGKTGILEETKCSNLPIAPYLERIPETYCLGALDYGTAHTGWHGATITRTLPADAAGNIGADNFTLSFATRFLADEKTDGLKQLGAFQMSAFNAAGNSVFGIRFYKDTVSRNYSYTLYCDRDDISGSIAAGNIGNVTITKSGKNVTFKLGKLANKRMVLDANETITGLTFAFEQYGIKPALTYNGLKWVKFVKHNCDTFKDIPNKFSANDVLEADCGKGEILLNGVASPELGALGNDWEEFYLTPGLNQIGFAFSDWVKAGCEPSFKIKYREVYL